jgi:hypothetical protein
MKNWRRILGRMIVCVWLGLLLLHASAQAKGDRSAQARLCSTKPTAFWKRRWSMRRRIHRWVERTPRPPDGGNSLGKAMSIHPFGLFAQPAFYPTEFTGAALAKPKIM